MGRRNMSTMLDPILQFCNATKEFQSGMFPWTRRSLRAVDGVTLDLYPGETFGIVGESGSGKSTLLRMALRLTRPTAGRVLFEGRDIASLSGPDLRTVRRRLQAVFQDPASSFNPRQSVAKILLAPLQVHQIGNASERRQLVGDTLELVGLSPKIAERFPHQLSGGQRQRVAIARAIIVKPSLIVADEPTSALDVSVQAQVLNLFKQTKRNLGLTYLFVSHNLGVIRYVSDRVAVMRLGQIVEVGRAHDIFTNPQHAYTRALLAAVPDTHKKAAEYQATLMRG
jgi:ABC-type oligopeptide transport system ATPase subunit